jgi:hypothetical protein
MALAKVEVAQKMKEYTMRYYGNLISADDPTFDEKEKHWKAQLKSNYPRLIKNDYPKEERFIRVMPLKGLGTICLNENLQFDKNCSIKREESIALIRSNLERWREQIENIVVIASSKQFAKTIPARVFLNPANMILVNLLKRKESFISFEQLGKLRRHTRIERWLALLEDLKLIKKIEEGYTYGEMFTTLEKETENDRQFETLSMAYILKKSYPLLKEIFHIQQFETFVHLDSCYYRPALDAPDIPLYQTADSLFKRYITEYRFRPLIELRHLLHELHQSEALCQTKQYYYKNDAIFQDMLKLKSEIPESVLPMA